MRRIARWVGALLIGWAIVHPACAQTNYPEIWERRLATPDDWTFEDRQIRAGSPVIGRRADGEVVIVMTKDGRYWSTEFFSGRSETGLLAERARPILEDLELQDEHDQRIRGTPSNIDHLGCYDGLDASIWQSVHISSRGYHLIARLASPRPAPLRPTCARQATLRYTEAIVALPTRLHLLDDGSFIAVAPEIGTAIRIRADFSSPAIDHRRLFLVHLWHVDGEGDGQAKHDAVLAKLDRLPPAHAEPRLGPPFPDVWWRELPDLGPAHRLEWSSGILPNGDVAILLKNRDRFAVLEFFAGRVSHGRDAYERLDRALLTTFWPVFSDGATVSLHRIDARNTCYISFNASNTLVRANPRDDVVGGDNITWYLVAYLERPRNPPLRKDCASNRINYREWVVALQLTSATAAEDDTLVVVAPEIGRALRLTRTLQPPTLDRHRLFTMTEDEVGWLIGGEPKHAHDRIKLYLDRTLGRR